MKLYAFVGPSGTGKSHRAQMVAKMKHTEFIIDDALFIKGNKVISGTSAKRAATKVESVKRALFTMPGQVEEIRAAIDAEKPESILILGTSDEMVAKIAQNILNMKIDETVYIQDVSTPQEIAAARSARMAEGKHVIPVPTFEIKKDFSGYLVDPLQIFKWKGKGTAPYMAEKSLIRPTFSYLGNYTISDNVIRSIIEHMSKGVEGIYKIQRIKIDTYPNGIFIYIDVIMEYGYNLMDILNELKRRCIKEIDRLTAINVIDLQILAKGLHVNENK